MSVSASRKERVIGCIVGGAIGDALGAPYEGAEPPIQIDSDIGLLLTDDTCLTLATCEAIIAQGFVDPAAIAERSAAWFKAGRIVGIGASTYKALSELAAGGHWALCGSKGERAAGNGAAMRIAPLAFFLDLDDSVSRRTLRDVARITHQNEEAYVGALAVGLAVRIAWSGRWPDDDDLLGTLVPQLPDSRVREHLDALAGLGFKAPLLHVAERCGTSGHVVESVPMAVCAAQRVRQIGFESMIRDVILCGGDTDSIASMAGQIAGALIGIEKLPKSLIQQLPNRQQVVETARKLAAAVPV